MKENKETNQSENQGNDGTSRRSFIGKMSLFGAGLAAGALSLGASQNEASAQTGNRKNTKSASNASIGRRRLGKLEVSAIGMGVQNMHRKYTTEVPYRPEMINILRAA